MKTFERMTGKLPPHAGALRLMVLLLVPMLLAPCLVHAAPKILEGSFIQPWLAKTYDDSDWETEFQYMSDVGMCPTSA